MRILTLPLFFLLMLTAAFGQDHDVQVAPFEAIRWPEATPDQPEILLEGEWFGWTAIDDTTVEELFEFCEERWRGRAKKRIGEDLFEALTLMGNEPEMEVSLTLIDLSTGAEIERDGVAMTSANRQSVLRHNNGRGRAPAPKKVVKRVERAHATTALPKFEFLTTPLVWSGWSGAPVLTRAEAERDLDQLEWLVEHTYSYADLLGVDYRAAFDALRLGLQERNNLGHLQSRISQVLALFGDGHTRVRGSSALKPSGYLPFLVADTDEGVLAFRADRSGPVDPEYPFLIALDGVSCDAWVETASRSLAAGSPQFVRFHGLRDLRELNALRLERGDELTDAVEVTLANAAGETRVTTHEIANRKPTYGPWPRSDRHRALDGDIGYVRVPSMDDDAGFLAGLKRAVESFRESNALIIDVRGNGGGSRDALRTLLPFFLPPTDGPRVVNVAAYRLPPDVERGKPEGYLDNRFLFPATSSRWNAAEKTAIAKVAEAFTPAWVPDREKFSAWHYFVISPSEDFYFDKPVVILHDSGCFSATDIFLAGFDGVPKVQLMGTPSGGGSGRSRGSRLEESGISVRFSSMASFRANGELYDGVGVQPDRVVLPKPSDFIRGGSDSVLEAAVRFLERSAKPDGE